MILIINVIFERISKSIPNLKVKLKKAGMDDKPEEFIKKTVLTAFYMTAGICIFLFLILARYGGIKLFMLLFPPILFGLIFVYMLNFPDAKIKSQEREINKEVVFAGRYLIIELESGVAVYSALINTSRSYEVIGRYFKKIVDEVNLGNSLEQSLNQATEMVPSNNLRKILWQILNASRTGSDISRALTSVLDQIVREQKIEVSAYGKKLNPLAMFYMIMAVILPTLGITMLVILSSFIDIELDLTILLVIAFFLAFIQFMFLSIIKFQRPAVEF